MMTPTQVVDSCRKWAAQSLEQARRGDAQNAITNLSAANDKLILKACVEWRVGLGDPSPAFRQAAAVAREAAAIWPEVVAWYRRHAGKPLAPEAEINIRPYYLFAFPTAALASTLITARPDATLAPMLPGRADWTRGQGERWHCFLDPLVLHAIQGPGDPQLAEAILAYGRKRRSLALPTRTWANYLEAADAARSGDWPALAERTQDAVKLFKERNRSAWFREGSGYNGGLMNDYLVDFRMAAILRPHQDRPELAGAVPDELRWRW